MNGVETKQKKPLTLVVYAILILLAAVELLPLAQIFFNAFRTNAQIKSMPIGLPTSLSFDNLYRVWTNGGYAHAFANSFFIGGCVIIIVLIFAGLCSYALSKLRFKLNGFLTAYFMVALSLPGFLFIVPDYFMFNALGLVNNRITIIIIYAATQLPFNILLIRSFFVNIPRELEEAGKIDGCNEFMVFLKITLPLAKPIMLTVALLVFLSTWNEFLFANTFLQQERVKTVATMYVKFTSEHIQDLSGIFGASLITVLPIIVLFLFFQRTFISGLASGGLKG